MDPVRGLNVGNAGSLPDESTVVHRSVSHDSMAEHLIVVERSEVAAVRCGGPQPPGPHAKRLVQRPAVRVNELLWDRNSLYATVS